MDLYVKGHAPDAGSPQVPFEGWVVAAALHPDSGEFKLLISDESSGEGMRRLRPVPVNCVVHHSLSGRREQAEAA